MLLQQTTNYNNNQTFLTTSVVTSSTLPTPNTTIFNPNAARFMPQITANIAKEEAENNDFSFFDTDKLLKFAASYDEATLNDSERTLLPSIAEIAWNSVDSKENSIQSSEQKDSLLRNPHWMNDISVGININENVSQENSPLQDDYASSTSSLMSRSSDSGFRSTLYIGDDDSSATSCNKFQAINCQSESITTIIDKNEEKFSRCETPVDSTSSLSEHMEFTYSHATTTSNSETKLKRAQIHRWNSRVDSACDVGSAAISSENSDAAALSEDEDDEDDIRSCISTSDTSDDASVINEDFLINDETIGIAVPTETPVARVVEQEKSDQNENYNSIEYISMHSTHNSTKKTQQLFKDVDIFMKNSIDIGIYSCKNKSNSFFVGPGDDLKPLKHDDYTEYQLFPMMEARFINSYPEFF